MCFEVQDHPVNGPGRHVHELHKEQSNQPHQVLSHPSNPRPTGSQPEDRSGESVELNNSFSSDESDDSDGSADSDGFQDQRNDMTIAFNKVFSFVAARCWPAAVM
jgi:hypothetical protein